MSMRTLGGVPDLNGAYLRSAAAPGIHIDLTVAQGGIRFDGAALAAGAAGTAGPDYMRITRGLVSVLSTAYNATDLVSLVYSTALNGLDIGPDPSVMPERAIISLGVPDRLTFLRQDRTITTGSPGFFRWVSALSLDAAIPLLARSFGGFIDLGGTFQFNASASPFGMGNALLHRATWKNANAVVANLGPSFLFANNATYQADGATITASQARIFFDNASYSVINAGVGSMGAAVGHVSFYSNLIINTGWTLQLRRGLLLQDATVTGFLVDQIVVDIVDMNAGSGLNIGVRSALLGGVGKFFIQHTGTARSDFGGILGLGLGATVDWEISRVAADLASLADGDSLRITTGSLLMGAAGTVELSVSVANRLDLASGDSLRIVNGTFEHIGALFGIHGAVPVVQSAAYTRTAAIVEDRTLLASASATTLNNNNVLAALIADLQANGILG